MLVVAISLVLLARQDTLPNENTKPKLSNISYKLPLLGGWKEIVLGPLVADTQYYGYYAQYPMTFNNIGNMRIKNPDYYADDRVGYMSWSVTNYPRNGKSAYLLQTDGTYKQAVQVSKRREFDFQNHAKASYWISLDGKLLEEDFLIKVIAGTFAMQAIFNDDTYDLTVTDPFRGERKSTVHPGCGMDKLEAIFEPMIKDGKEVIKEKEFYALDPVTGAPVKCTAKIGGRWDGKMFNNTKYQGKYVDIDGVEGHERVFVSDQNVLFRVETSDHHYLSIEEKPDSTLSTKKVGG